MLVDEIPKECAVKVFKTTLNEFKTRDKYIKDDYRFKERFSKQVSIYTYHELQYAVWSIMSCPIISKYLLYSCLLESQKNHPLVGRKRNAQLEQNCKNYHTQP